MFNKKVTKKGFLNSNFLIIILVFAIIMLLPILFSVSFPIIKLIIMAYFALLIFVFVRNILGASILTYVVSGLLIYILVVKFWYLFAPAYMLYLIGSMFLSGLIIFGLQKGP